MNKKSIFNIFCLALMSFSALFVANLSPYLSVSADSIPIVLIENNKYIDAKGNYYEQAIAGVSKDATNQIFIMPSTKTNPTRGTTLYFQYEPIVWQVLNVENNIALVVSNKILANIPFQSTYSGDDTNGYYTTANGAPSGTKANDYTYSNIRYWLNGYEQKAPTGSDMDYLKTNCNITSRTLNYGSSFYDTAFSSSEQNKILATTGIGASDATTYVYGEFSQIKPTSADKIFVLSRADATNTTYYSSDVSRQKSTTDYAGSQGASNTYDSNYKANTGTEYNGYWWLRSPDSSISQYARFVIDDGREAYSRVQDVYDGVAPAMYLNTTGLTFYTDATCATITTAAAKTYVKFGSYPQTVADCTTYIDMPPTGVSINTAGVVLSGTILLGLMTGLGVWVASHRKNSRRLDF